MYCIINVDAFIAKLCLPPISLVMFAAVLIRFEIHFECFLLFFFIATILVLEYTKHENRNHWFQANIFNCSIQPAIPLVDFVHYMDYKHTDTHTHKFMRTHWLIECLNNRNGLTLKLYCNTNDKHHRSNFFFLVYSLLLSLSLLFHTIQAKTNFTKANKYSALHRKQRNVSFISKGFGRPSTPGSPPPSSLLSFSFDSRRTKCLSYVLNISSNRISIWHLKSTHLSNFVQIFHCCLSMSVSWLWMSVSV